MVSAYIIIEAENNLPNDVATGGVTFSASNKIKIDYAIGINFYNFNTTFKLKFNFSSAVLCAIQYWLNLLF